MKRQLLLTGFLLSAAPAWAFGASDLAKHESTLTYALFVLGPLALGLGIWEFIELRKGGSDGLTLDIDRLAAAAAQKQARAVTPDPESSPAGGQDSGAHRAVAPPPPPRGVAPPPPPPPRGAVPPPPPPPAARSGGGASPTDSGDVSPFARLSQIGQQADDPNKPAIGAGRPIGLPSGGGAPPPPPPPVSASPAAAPAAGGGGGWADLLQRVRSGEPEGGSGGASPPAPSSASSSSEEERPAGLSLPGAPPGFPGAAPAAAAPSSGGGSDAWEALLKKTTAGSPPPSGTGSSRSAGDPNPLSKLNLPSTGGETGGGNPFAAALGDRSGGGIEGLGAGSSQDEALPDFVKKASRTISLDLKKGGGSTPPPPLPKTEG